MPTEVKDETCVADSKYELMIFPGVPEVEVPEIPIEYSGLYETFSQVINALDLKDPATPVALTDVKGTGASTMPTCVLDDTPETLIVVVGRDTMLSHVSKAFDAIYSP